MNSKKQDEEFRPKVGLSETPGRAGESQQSQMGTSSPGRGIEGSPDVGNIPGSTGISGLSADERNSSRQSGSQVDLSSVNNDRLGGGNLSGSNQAGGNPSAGSSQLSSDRSGVDQSRVGGRMDEPDAIGRQERRSQQGRSEGFSPEQGGGLDLPRH